MYIHRKIMCWVREFVYLYIQRLCICSSVERYRSCISIVHVYLSFMLWLTNSTLYSTHERCIYMYMYIEKLCVEFVSHNIEYMYIYISIAYVLELEPFVCRDMWARVFMYINIYIYMYIYVYVYKICIYIDMCARARTPLTNLFGADSVLQVCVQEREQVHMCVCVCACVCVCVRVSTSEWVTWRIHVTRQCRALLQSYSALLQRCTALLRSLRAFLQRCTALFRSCRALLQRYRALFWMGDAFVWLDTNP